MGLFGPKRNTRLTPVKTILEQMQERRPLPMGVKAFHEWADRIISGACVPGATVESQKFALADMILHLGPTESHKEDAYFIHCMRKYAVNQVADAMRKEIRDAAKERLAKEQETEKKLAIEKRYEDQIALWSQDEKDQFIHRIYLQENEKENKVVNISAKPEITGATTPPTGAGDGQAPEKTGP